MAPVQIARLFATDPVTVELAASLLAIGALFQMFDGVQGVSSGILRGTGDTLVPMLIHLGGFWGLGVPLSLFLAFGLNLGPRGVWWGYVGSLFAVAFLQLWRVRWRLRQDVKRLRIEDSGEFTAPA